MSHDRNKAGMIREDFTLIFEIAKIGAIKAWKAGEHNKNFVKFRSTNTENVVDKEVGFRELETIIDFQVETNTLEEAILLKDHIFDMKLNGEVLKFRGLLPKRDGYDEILKIKNVDTFEGFLKLNNIDLYKKK